MKIIALFSSLLVAGALWAEPMIVPRFYWAVNKNMLNHPGDYPFPTDMTFRAYADHRIDQTTHYFDPDLVNKGDTIYLADYCIPWFVSEIHPRIKHPYILISNDGDATHPDSGTWHYNPEWASPPAPVHAIRQLLYDSKVAAWFAKNLVVSRHPKLFPLPIGQNIIYWDNFPSELVSLVQKNTFEKKHLLYMNMQLSTNPERARVAELFQDQPYCFSRVVNLAHNLITKAEFCEDLSQSMFTVAPPGLGPDTVRFWEAIVLDCIPIVKHSCLDDLYADLPVLFVDDWEDVSEEFLRQKYVEIQKISKEKAFFGYWANKIDAVQKAVREDRNTFSSIQATQFDKDKLEDIVHVIKNNVSAYDVMLFKGAIMGLRPFEIVDKCHSFLAYFFVQDPWGTWGHEWSGDCINKFTDDPLIAAHFRKMWAVTYFDDFQSFFKPSEVSKMHVFLDLSYQRHQLENDLDWICAESWPSTLICGTMAKDPYVNKVLQKFALKTNVRLEYRSDIWYFKTH